MSATVITIAEINNEMSQAVAAVRAGDYATAFVHAICAQGLLAVKPDTTFSDEELTYDREAIANFAAEMKKLSRSQSIAASSIVGIPVRQRPSYTGFDDASHC